MFKDMNKMEIASLAVAGLGTIAGIGIAVYTKIKTGKELTLDLLYDITNPYGFRDFDWEEFKMNPSLDRRILKTICDFKEGEIKITKKKVLL